MAPAHLSSAKPFLALLQETEHELIDFALKSLLKYMEEYWFEMAAEVALIIEVAESDSLTTEVRQRASLVASQVLFHTGKLSESVKFALSAGAMLDVGSRSEYTDTIVGACVDLYVSLREKQAAEAEAEERNMIGGGGAAADAAPATAAATAEDAAATAATEGPAEDSAAAAVASSVAASGVAAASQPSAMQRYASTAASSYEPSPEVDARVAEVFERLATTWQDDNVLAAKEMVGFCLRARRTDLLVALLKRTMAQDTAAAAAASSSSSTPASPSSPPSSSSSSTGGLLSHAFQVSMAHVRDMRFRREAIRALSELYSQILARDATQAEVFEFSKCLVFLEDVEGIAKVLHGLLKGGHTTHAMQLAFDVAESSNQELIQKIIKALETAAAAAPAAAAAEGEVDSTSPAAGASSRIGDIVAILSGSVSTDLYLKFLFSRCKADVPMFQKMKKVIPAKSSVLVSAVVTSGCLSYSGTAHDSFLRDNISILARLSDWAKYSAAASLGVVHRGHTSEIMSLLKPYLPSRGNVSALPFQEAGALFALGLATCGSAKNDESVKYLKDALTDFSASEQLVHGASMGLGLAALGLRDTTIADQLFTCVTTCDAVASEGAAVAIGLNMMGAADDALCQQMLNAAREPHQKEKTIRGLAMGIALLMLRRESLALPLVDDMAADRDPWVRVGACYVLGLAYAATDSTLAIEKLLRLCVSDAHDEVRRASIMMIGFVALANVAHCVQMVRPFTDNYSPHVRYGVAMALAVASAGAPDPAVLRLLRRLGDDAVNFVRQGAVIAQALVLIQATEAQTAYVKEFRAKLWTLISDAKTDMCCKFGCVLAAGLIDAGGRNCTIALHRNGAALLRPIVGMFLFSQHWHWFPNILPVCLALQPTCVIGLNDKLQMPQLNMVSNAAPTQFAPPPTMQEEKAKDAGGAKKAMATLSATTMKEQKKAEDKKKLKLDGDSASARPSSASAGAAPAADGGDKGKKEGDDASSSSAKKEEDAAPTKESLQNPARVTKAQLAVLEMEPDQRYVPLRGKLGLGINMLVDAKPDEGEDTKLFVVDFSQRSDDVKPPEPFSWP